MIIDKIIIAAYVPWWPNIIMGCLCLAVFFFVILYLFYVFFADEIIWPKSESTEEKDTTIRIIFTSICEGKDENTADDNENKAELVESKHES